MSPSLALSHGRKRLLGIYVFYSWVILLSQFLVTFLFCLISLQSTRFVSFSVETTFLLQPVSFAAVLKLSRPHIHTSGWVQFNTPGLFLFVCEWIYIYLLVTISFSKNLFFLALYIMCYSSWKDVDLLTLIISTDDHYFCFFAVQFQSFLSSLLHYLQLIQ